MNWKPGTYKLFLKSRFPKQPTKENSDKVDEGFIMNIEMIENNDFEIMPSPGSFSGM